ncbi:MAG: glucosaminidase domain-containing protein, partial [Eubacterium sp.]|nr:glucosaminidase domain-containing protein [Eubacterium sp.]
MHRPEEGRCFFVALFWAEGSEMSYGEKLDNGWYRVRKAWSDEESQKGAFQIFTNAKVCADENPGYSVFDPDGNAVYTSKKTGLQAKELKNLSEEEAVKKVGPLFTADQKKSGILASVSAAQFILESGYGKTDLAQGANNCFGMKKSLSGNTWAGSTWDGKSVYTKKTQEDDGRGNLYYITADFRKYPCVEDSIADHSAYLLGAKNGNSLRYAGLKGCTDYKKAIQIIKDGGYATDTKYVAKICEIIERWNLTQFEVKGGEVSRLEEAVPAKYPDRPIIDITKENLSEVPARRGSNKIQFIVVHYLGVPNADNPYLYGGGYGGHYNIKRDGSVYKAADPKTAVVWHCGGGLQGSGGHTFHGICTNYNSIGIECGVCYTNTSVKDASGDSNQWYFTTETQESLVWLVAKLMKEYGIGIDHVIRHYDVSGKICPNPYVKNNRLRTSWTWD